MGRREEETEIDEDMAHEGQRVRSHSPENGVCRAPLRLPFPMDSLPPLSSGQYITLALLFFLPPTPTPPIPHLDKNLGRGTGRVSLVLTIAGKLPWEGAGQKEDGEDG
jgi:hypothetical protein